MDERDTPAVDDLGHPLEGKHVAVTRRKRRQVGNSQLVKDRIRSIALPARTVAHGATRFEIALTVIGRLGLCPRRAKCCSEYHGNNQRHYDNFCVTHDYLFVAGTNGSEYRGGWFQPMA